MSVINSTPLEALAFPQLNMLGRRIGVLSVRGTFKLTQSGKLKFADPQPPFQMTDEYADDPLTSTLLKPTELVPFKTTTDITYMGSTYAPGGKAAKSWSCGLSIGSVDKNLRVYGPRAWERKKAKNPTNLVKKKEKKTYDWTLSEAQPTDQISLDWTKAYGGKIPSDDPESLDACNKNLMGCGIINEHIDIDVQSVPAPQIEAKDTPIIDWKKEYEPEGFAPIPPFWRQRQQYTGTCDDAWLENRHPLLPVDFDFRFWQYAHPDLQTDTYLKGGESFELRNLIYGHESFKGELPNINLGMRIKRANGSYDVGTMTLDGVHFDMRPEQGTVSLTWRTAFPWEDGEGQPELFLGATVHDKEAA